MQKWEHQIVVINFEPADEPSAEPNDVEEAVRELNALGEEGWEAAGVVASPEKGKARVIFKRPIAVF